MQVIVHPSGSKIKVIPGSSKENIILEDWFNPHIKDYMNDTQVKLGQWDGRINFWNDGNLPFGLWKELTSCAAENNFDITVEGKEYFPRFKDVTKTSMEEWGKDFFKYHRTDEGLPFIPYNHQNIGAYTLLRNRYSTVEVATGGGKSLIFSMALFNIWKTYNSDIKVLLITPSKSLVRQFYEDIHLYSHGFNNENPSPIELKINEMMSDKPNVHGDDFNLVIGTYQSLSKLPKTYFKQFTFVVADEAHGASNASVKYILSSCKNAFWRCGMSGTYPREKTAEWFQIQSLTGPIDYKITAKELQDLGVIAPLKIKFLLLNHEDKAYGETMKKLKSRGGGIKAFELERKYVHKSKKRNEFLKKLICKSDRPTLLLFYTTDWGTSFYEECVKTIKTKEFYYIDGDVKEKDRTFIKKRMDSEEGLPKVLIASYGCLSTGISIKSISRLILADSFKEQKLIRQSIGRGLRLHKNKKELLLLDIVDKISNDYSNSTFLNHFRERKSIYYEQEWEYELLEFDL